MVPDVKGLRLFSDNRRAVIAISTVAFFLAAEVAVDCHSTALAADARVSMLPSIAYGGAVWLWWGIVTTAYWLSLRYLPRVSSFTPRTIVVHALSGICIVFAHAFVLYETMRWILRSWPVLERAGYDTLNFFGARRLGSEFLLYGFIVGACISTHLYLKSQEEKIRSAQLEEQLSAAQLHALQMQIDPHFLFNTLNSVTALVKFNHNAAALETLENLNGLLRKTLASKSPAKVSLGTEIAMIESYLAIEQVRFSDRLSIDLRIDPEALRGLVPCFILQPLVENAIRHGISNCLENGVVETRAQRAGDQLHLYVRDNGPGVAIANTRGHGIGLKNTRDRLSHFYRDNFSMSAKPLERGGFEVSIRIPFEQVGL